MVDGGESLGGRRGRCERRLRGSCCHQALICVCLVSEEDLFALLRAIYLTMRRGLVTVEPVLDCSFNGLRKLENG